MNDRLTAGEPLAPRRDDRPGRPEDPRRKPKADKPRAKRRNPLRWLSRLFGALLAVGVIAAGAGGLAAYSLYQHVSADLPDVDTLRHYQPRVMSRIYASDSQLLAELATERRIFVPYAEIPDLVKRAFVSAEDQNFFIHRGVDPLAIARAALTNLAHYGEGRRPVGASTITQQVAKNMLLNNNEVSLSRKAKEAILALRIERALTKERILELYLNEIYLGMGSYGVAAAAQTYFNKSLDDLTPAEAAFLAALPKAPNNYNPFRFPDAAKARRDWVLDRMAEDHVITADQAATAKDSPIAPAAFRRPDTVAGADYFTEEVRRELVDHFGADQATTGGLSVRTTLDPALQEAASRTLREGLMRYDRQNGGWRGPVAKLDAGPGLRSGWASALAGVARPPGMLPDWRLAVVLEETDSEAKLGMLDRPANATAPTPRVLPMPLSEITWARPLRDGKPGPTPRRMADVVQPGDVVMAEIVPGTAAQGRNPARPERLTLRQIPQVEGAIVTIEPSTGRVLAMDGGWSFEMSQFNRATQANRQPGSSFKPFVYLTALEKGVSPSQRFLDAPYVVNLADGSQWRPGNYELDFNGPVPLHTALVKSLNLVTIRVAAYVGMQAVADTAAAFHVVDNLPKVLPAALGAADTTVLREAAAYASLDEGGKEVTPTLIDSVQDRDGHVIWAPSGIACDTCTDPSHPPQLDDMRPAIADPQSVFQVVTMMQDVVQRGTGTAAGQGLDRAIAGKTGTTQDFQDAWFVGFTPDLVTAVWVGFDNPASLGNNETGGAIAAPIWHDYMAVALKGRPKLNFVAPPGVTLATYDGGITDAFKPDQVPGASGPSGGGEASASATPDGSAGAPAAPAPAAAGVDSALGGLY